ncbi:MAG: ribonuclease P protein component [Candidatus Saccharimonas sp.]
MISAKLRFHGHGSLRFLHKNANTYRSRYFAVKVIANPHRKHARFAVIVSKKTHKSAVGRNRIRRRVYEILRLESTKLSGVYDIAVIVTSGEVLTADYAELTNSLRSLLAQANVYGSR